MPVEVLCEVIYVLENVYYVNRTEIRDTLVDLIQQPKISLHELATIFCAFDLYKDSRFDFVDCLLFGYAVNNKN